MKNKLKKIIKNSRGFTLAETLLAILILLMVSSILAAGIPVAREAYEKVVLASNAEVALSTAVSTLRNELGMAQRIEAAKPGVTPVRRDIIYYNPSRGSYSKIEVSDNNVVFTRYYNKDSLSLTGASSPQKLISDITATQGLYVTYTSVTYEKGIVTFSGLSVNHISGREGLASRAELSIRVISYQQD